MWKRIGAGPATGARAVLRSGSLLCGLALAVAAFAPTSADAGTLYRWTTDSGGIAFADDAKRIPERYRDRAEQITTEGLSGYERFTPTDTAAAQRQAESLAERLAAQREAAGTPGAPAETVVLAPAPQPAVQGIALQSVRETSGRRLVQTPNGPAWRRTSSMQTVDAPVPVLGVRPDPDSDAPIIVERVRARPDGSNVTRHVTVVRQGDEVLSVIKPRPRQSSSNWVRESDLEAGR